jgi:hypothetical protein
LSLSSQNAWRKSPAPTGIYAALTTTEKRRIRRSAKSGESPRGNHSVHTDQAVEQGPVGGLASVLEPPVPIDQLRLEHEPAHQEPLEDLSGALRVRRSSAPCQSVSRADSLR